MVMDVTDSEIFVLCRDSQVSPGIENRLTQIRKYFLEEAIVTGNTLVVFLYPRQILKSAVLCHQQF